MGGQKDGGGGSSAASSRRSSLASSASGGASATTGNSATTGDSGLDESPEGGGVNAGDRLMHWWCQKELRKCLKRLQRHDDAGPFMEPVPWEELGLDDYLEVVKEPMDLETVGEYLEYGEYETDDGLVNPDWFWEDVQLCWDNCLAYYEGEEDVEAFKMALSMQDFAEELEDEFWDALDIFEENLGKVDPALRSIAAAADTAANAVVDAAANSAVLMSDLSAALYSMLGGWGGGGGGGEPPPMATQKKKKAFKLGPLAKRQDLLDFFQELLENYYADSCDLDVALQDMDDIHADLHDAFGFEMPEISKNVEQELQDQEAALEQEAQAFDGADQKRPLAELLPSDFRSPLSGSQSKASMDGTTPRLGGASGLASGAATPRASSRASSRRGSKSGREARGSRRSAHGSRNNSRVGSEGSRRISCRSGSSRGTQLSQLSGSQFDSEEDEPKVVKTFSRTQMASAMPQRKNGRRSSIQTTTTTQTVDSAV